MIDDSAAPLVPEASSRRDDDVGPARRALAEAEARRRARADAPAPPPEIGGREGPEPVRYGDWETKGIATDF